MIPPQTNSAALDNAGGNLVIDVLNNDTDANNAPGLPGGSMLATVTILNPASGGQLHSQRQRDRYLFTNTTICFRAILLHL